jgi:hypothetical protein
VDGPALPIIVVTSSSQEGIEESIRALIEETFDQKVEFGYKDFMEMIHKRVKAKTTA